MSGTATPGASAHAETVLLAAPAPDADTVPKLLLSNAQRIGDRPAIREKALGIWQTWTWAQVLDEVRVLGASGAIVVTSRRAAARSASAAFFSSTSVRVAEVARTSG